MLDGELASESVTWDAHYCELLVNHADTSNGAARTDTTRTELLCRAGEWLPGARVVIREQQHPFSYRQHYSMFIDAVLWLLPG